MACPGTGKAVPGGTGKAVAGGLGKAVAGGPGKAAAGAPGKAAAGAPVKGVGGGPVKGVGGGPVKGVGGGPVKGVGGGPVKAVAGGPVKGVGGAPVKGVGGAPVKGVGGAPVKGVGGGPVKAVGGGPVKAVGGGPVKAVAGAPEKGVGGAPEKGVGGAPEKGVGGAPVKGVGGAPVKGVGGGPVKGVGGGPVKGVGGGPVKGVGGGPVKGVGGGPVKAVAGAPEKGVGGGPVKAVGGAPEKGVGGAPVKGVGGAPVKGVGGAPVKGVGGGPVKGVGGGPVKGAAGGPVKAVGGAPVKAVGGAPVKAVGGGPVKGAAGGPVKGAAGGPVKGAAGGPVKGAAGGPVKGAAGGPVKGAGGRPVKGAGGGPVKGVGGGPVKGVGGRPVKGVGGGPVKGVGGGPVKGVGGGPVKGVGGGPVKGVGGGPVKGAAGVPVRLVAGVPGRVPVGVPGRVAAGVPGKAEQCVTSCVTVTCEDKHHHPEHCPLPTSNGLCCVQEVEHSESVNKSISRKQEDWEAKWKNRLGVCPFNLTLNNNPDLDLRALPPSSSDLEEEKAMDQIIASRLASLADDEEWAKMPLPVSCNEREYSLPFLPYSSKYLAEMAALVHDIPPDLMQKIKDTCGSAREVRDEEDDEPLENVVDKSTASPGWVSSVPLEFSEAPENRDVRTEKVESPVKKEDLLKYATEKLAEEVAEAVISDSPQTSEGKGRALEDLTNTLAFNPFSARREIPRTAENLLTETRSSWRKAIQTDGLSDTEQAPAEEVIEEAPMDARSTMQKAADPTSVSPARDFDCSLSERKSQFSSTEFRLQEKMVTGHSSESLVSKSSGVRESEQTEEQELKWSVGNERFVEEPKCVKMSVDISDTCSENSSRACSLPSGDSRDSFMGVKTHSLPSLKFISILDETLTEELGSIDLSTSGRTEFDLDVIDSADGFKNENIQTLEQDLELEFKTREVLKKTASTTEELRNETDSGGEPLSCISETILAPEESCELFRPPELVMDDEEWAKMPLPVSCNEREYSLPFLPYSSKHLAEMAALVHDIPPDLMQKIKDIQKSNEELDMKKPLSG